jgi:hypothetical protein
MTKLEQLRAALEELRAAPPVSHKRACDRRRMRNRLSVAIGMAVDSEDYADRILARYKQLKKDGVL